MIDSYFLVLVCVLCLFLTVPWVGLQCVILAFSDHPFCNRAVNKELIALLEFFFFFFFCCRVAISVLCLFLMAPIVW